MGIEFNIRSGFQDFDMVNTSTESGVSFEIKRKNGGYVGALVFSPIDGWRALSEFGTVLDASFDMQDMTRVVINWYEDTN